MKIYSINIDGARSLPMEFIQHYCQENEVGIYLDVSDEFGILCAKSSIQIYQGKDKVSRIRKRITDELDVKELLR